MAAIVTPTLESLVRDARVLLNQPKAENSRFSDAELTKYANQAVKQVFGIVNKVSEGQFDKTTTLNIVNAVETVALPSDCFAIKALYKVQNQVNRRLEYRSNIMMDYDNSSSNTGSTTYEPYYYLRVNNIVLRPIPGFSETASLVLEYTAYPSILQFGGDSLDSGVSPLFEELITTYIVFKCKLKDDLAGGGNSRQAAKEHLSDLYNNFKDQLSERSKAPQYITVFEPL